MTKKINIFMYFMRSPEFGAFIGFLVIFLLFSIISTNFLSLGNFSAIFTAAAELGIISIGINFLVISGEFDLSVGSVFAVIPMLFAILVNTGISPYFSFVISMFCALLIGFLNGLITLRARIPSFIATLGMMMFWRGILLAVSKGFPISYSSKSKVILNILNSRVFGGLRMSSFWFLIIAIIFSILLVKTRYGNWLFATGGSTEVAKAMGINTERIKMINFLISSLLAGFAGCVSLARFNIVDPTLGSGLELEALSAVVIGGTFLSGGYGSIIGTFVGALLIGMVRSGLILAGAPAYWYTAFIGIMLIVSVSVNAKIRSMVLGE
ncbi:MAG: ABC transporter permease [Atribacterota bacterium]|nr:ABC transporter permease [Atribacterota bacterium]